MRVVPWAALSWLALGAVGCGTSSTASVAASSPSPAVPTSPGLAAPSLAPSASVGLSFTGVLSGNAGSLVGVAPCGPTTNGLFAQIGFPLGGTDYQLVIEIAGYNGPGTYPAPPVRVSVHKAVVDNAPQLLTGTGGQVVVDQGGASGTVDEDLRGSQGTAHVAGRWSC